MKNKKHTTIKLAAGIFAAASLALAGCKDGDNVYDGPQTGNVTLTTTWDNTNLGEAPAAGYIVVAGDYYATVKKNPASQQNLLPGRYTGYFYTAADKITVGGVDANTVASVAPATAPQGEAGTFIAPRPAFFYSATKDMTIERNKKYDITVPMNQQVKELTFIIRPSGDVAHLITGVTAVVSGVSGQWNLHSDQPQGNAMKVAVAFSQYGNDWIATVRLLGITGATQVLSGRIAFSDNLDPVTFSRNLHDVTGFAAFNSDKKTPMALEAQLVDVHDEFSLGDFETIADWTGREEEVNAQNRSYQVTGSVTDILTSDNLQGVTVLARAGTGVETGDYFTVGGTTISAVTNAAGQFSLALPNGPYTLEFNLDGYDTGFANVSVSGGNVAVGAKRLSTTTYQVSGTISSVSGSDIAGTVIKVRRGHDEIDADFYAPGGNVLSATTDASGEYSLSLPNGYYTLAITYGSFFTAFVNITVADSDVSGMDAELNAWIEVGPDGYDVSGTVTSALTNNPLPYASIKVRSGLNVTAGDYVQALGADMAVQSGDDGNYSLPLPDGNYTLEFSRTGYIAKYLSVTVAGGALTGQNIILSDVPEVDDTDGVQDWENGGGIIIHR